MTTDAKLLADEIEKWIGRNDAPSPLEDEEVRTIVRALRGELYVPQPFIPIELFNGQDVYVELGINSTLTARDVSNVLDAAVKVIRRNRRMVGGPWPAGDRRRAFVEGMKWWQFDEYKATAFPSEVDRAEAEAQRRFPISQHRTSKE